MCTASSYPSSWARCESASSFAGVATTRVGTDRHFRAASNKLASVPILSLSISAQGWGIVSCKLLSRESATLIRCRVPR